MINSIKAVVTDSVDPFYNISLEARLLDMCDDKTVYLYLWRNDRTVVIGKNQNAFKECRVDLLESEGGHLVRRLTGGGAVYHDKNNLNFSFVAHKDNYDLARQMAVVLHAVRRCGIKAEQNGRNDITVDGKKFSGNSFLTKGDIKLHNGTILIDTSSSEMEKYLTVSAEKMKSKGVNSVRSRVVNLKQLDKSLTTGKMAMLLLRSFGDIFDLPVQLIREDELDCEKIFEIEREVFQNDEFRFGKNPSFENSLKKRFDWGEIEICFSSEKGVITNVEVFSDALDAEAVEQTKAFLLGKPLAHLKQLVKGNDNKILSDAVSLF